MAKISTKEKRPVNSRALEELQMKAALLDELLELIEEKHLGRLMERTEAEKQIPLKKAEKLLA